MLLHKMCTNSTQCTYYVLKLQSLTISAFFGTSVKNLVAQLGLQIPKVPSVWSVQQQQKS